MTGAVLAACAGASAAVACGTLLDAAPDDTPEAGLGETGPGVTDGAAESGRRCPSGAILCDDFDDATTPPFAAWSGKDGDGGGVVVVLVNPMAPSPPNILLTRTQPGQRGYLVRGLLPGSVTIGFDFEISELGGGGTPAIEIAGVILDSLDKGVRVLLEQPDPGHPDKLAGRTILDLAPVPPRDRPFAPTEIDLAMWHHLVLTITADGGAGMPVVNISLDGKSVSSLNLPGTFKPQLTLLLGPRAENPAAYATIYYDNVVITSP